MPLTATPKLSRNRAELGRPDEGAKYAFHLVRHPRRSLSMRVPVGQAHVQGEFWPPSTLGKKSRPRMNTDRHDSAQNPRENSPRTVGAAQHRRENDRVAACELFKACIEGAVYPLQKT